MMARRKAELFTNLLVLKRHINGGTLPPMTPLTERAERYLDPAHTIGMGALREDPEKGLQCPVRGCGRWYHRLALHLNASHRQIGGAVGVKRLLSIPHRVGLTSLSHKAMYQTPERINILARARDGMDPDARQRRATSARARGKSRRGIRYRHTVATRNLQDRCETQLAHLIIDIANDLGRSPSSGEFVACHGHGLYRSVLTAFGSWSAALAHVGLRVNRGRSNHPKLEPWTINTLADAFREHYRLTNTLPTTKQAARSSGPVALPSPSTVFKITGTARWVDAMRQISALLNIRHGRYGLKRFIAPADRTHCVNGHEFTPDNIYWANGRNRRSRRCRTCVRERAAARRQRATGEV